MWSGVGGKQHGCGTGELYTAPAMAEKVWGPDSAYPIRQCRPGGASRCSDDRAFRNVRLYAKKEQGTYSAEQGTSRHQMRLRAARRAGTCGAGFFAVLVDAHLRWNYGAGPGTGQVARWLILCIAASGQVMGFAWRALLHRYGAQPRRLPSFLPSRVVGRWLSNRSCLFSGQQTFCLLGRPLCARRRRSLFDPATYAGTCPRLRIAGKHLSRSVAPW